MIAVSPTNQEENCPYCQNPSHRVHSHYRRHPADLPLADCTVRLDLTVNRFFCDNDDCEHTTGDFRRNFAENPAQRMPTVVKPYARHTNRLKEKQLSVAFAAGGEGGARLLRGLGMPRREALPALLSPDTLLRLIRNAKEPEVETPRVLGIDDWAIRKGQTYGTILVDLEKRKPIDLLPDRDAASVEQWLKSHPGVQIISRDRGTYYIKGATSGAPDAIQVADRWHLLKNLRENLERLLEGKPGCLKAAAAENSPEQPEKENQSATNDETPETVLTTAETQEQQTHEQPSHEERKLTSAEKIQLQRRQRRRQRYNLVKKLQQEGLSIREIARRTQISRQTVTKFANADECPMYPVGIKRKSMLEPYKNHIRQRLKEGCHKATRIFHELLKIGFSGSYCTVARWVRTEKIQMPGGLIEPKEVVPYSPRRGSWLLVKQKDEMTVEEKSSLERMIQADATVACAYTLGQRFGTMIRERDDEALLPWLKDVAESGIDTLKQFAKGIKQDINAVTNALRYEWSQGQVEGQVNRLKLIKRQMYGRANFDLLRKRVLFHPI